MYDFSDVLLIPITTDSILLKISEYDIFKFYCSSFIEVNKVFKSELRKDRSPSCCIQSYQNKLFYKDFATGDSVDCFGYVQKRFNCTFHESLRIIANDFGLISVKKRLNDTLPIIHEKVSYKQANTVIEVFKRSWDINDYYFWQKYKIDVKTLEKFEVLPLKFAFINNMRIDNKKSSLLYAYKFEDFYKIYRPMEIKFKWFSNTKSKNIQGFKQLIDKGDVLIITKSLKDIMVLYTMGFNSIAPQSESSMIPEDIMIDLKNRFKTIICLYDNDVTGILQAEILCKKYDIYSFFIPKFTGSKDISDFVKDYSLEQGKKLINIKIWQQLNKVN